MERRAIGVKNNDGRAEGASEIGVGKSRKEEDAGVVSAAAHGRGGVEGSKRWSKTCSFEIFCSTTPTHDSEYGSSAKHISRRNNRDSRTRTFCSTGLSGVPPIPSKRLPVLTGVRAPTAARGGGSWVLYAGPCLFRTQSEN